MYTAYSRSNNDELFEMMQEFISVPVIKCNWFNQWYEANDYLQFIIQNCPTRYAVNVDNDCFIHDLGAIDRIITVMKDNGFTHAGMCDSHVVPHRTNHGWVTNPFFNIFDCEGIRRCVTFPIHSGEGEFEPYNAFFKELYQKGNALFLDAATRSDMITTHLMDTNGDYFALHSWYSREFNNGQRDRIIKVYNDAKYYRSLYSQYR